MAQRVLAAVERLSATEQRDVTLLQGVVGGGSSLHRKWQNWVGYGIGSAWRG
jgi:hypothetical protein